ncbi:hypothetical protein K239x_03870 [Planctomycetes bacterium K23_9]|uniref:Uncharacterized protein n=2 Tax=Stieleria marina TaxID=1930275 RepID=A0A517NMU9_9BACT|nr:hypothetical protein K239x_03870 [Planctomycetes bacterium K23_9]
MAFGAAGTLTAKQLPAQKTVSPPLLDQSTQSKISVLLPRDRVPLSFVIDDSTCLVNMGHFCTPQFATAWPDRAEYKQPWQEWPREIPDSFVREFGEWCSENGVKGKYSIVPYPACVGWMDRELPGWSRRQLQDSLKLVRDLMVPNWDIHPEMITHTRVIDLKTGRPMQEINKATMENSFPQEKKSVDELAAYLAYALRILKNCGLPCEGVTTPGGFGNAVKKELPAAVHQAVRDVFGTELPHYFKYVEMGDDTEPKLENLSALDSTYPQVTANVLAGTGDWFGGWQGIRTIEQQRYLSPDGQTGRMADLIRARQPAVMLCHWPGMFNNGSKDGFHAFQSIVRTIASVYGKQTVWMKLSEIGRYWAAKRLTKITLTDGKISLIAPFATQCFTLSIPRSSNIAASNQLTLSHGSQSQLIKRVSSEWKLNSNTFFVDHQSVKVCFDLTKGISSIQTS